MITLEKAFDIQTPSAKVLCVAIRQDGAFCAAGDRDGITYVVDMKDGTVARKLKQHIEFVYAMAFDPDTGHLITTGRDKSLREWDVETGAFVQDLAGIFNSASARTLSAQSFKPNTKTHTKTVLCVACEAGRLMATGGQDAIVKYWIKGEPVRSFSWHDGPVTSVCFQPDTKILFSGSKDKTVRSWNYDNGAMLDKYTGHTDEVVGVCFDGPDHFISVDASGACLAWTVGIEQPRGTLFKAPGLVTSCALDSERHLLMLGLDDGRLIGIDAAFGPFVDAREPLFCLEDHAFAVRSIAIRNDRVVTCDNQGKIKGWNILS